jgi:DNA-binding NtrC family response regulator
MSNPSAVPAPSGKTILIAEDHDMVRQVLVEMLRPLGHHLLVARNGAEAMEMSHRHAGPINLLITDVVMPRLGGHELATQLKTRHPGLKVLYVSGYANLDSAPQASVAPDIPFLDKPFEWNTLNRKVRELLTEEWETSP